MAVVDIGGAERQKTVECVGPTIGSVGPAAGATRMRDGEKRLPIRVGSDDSSSSSFDLFETSRAEYATISSCVDRRRSQSGDPPLSRTKTYTI